VAMRAVCRKDGEPGTGSREPENKARIATLSGFRFPATGSLLYRTCASCANLRSATDAIG
jgi:hypothetical protein